MSKANVVVESTLGKMSQQIAQVKERVLSEGAEAKKSYCPSKEDQNYGSFWCLIIGVNSQNSAPWPAPRQD